MNDNLRKQKMFDENSKSMGMAYLLWLCFGLIGIHRIYAGKTKSGLVRLFLTFIPLIGWAIQGLLWVVDAFLIPGMINDHNRKTINMINHESPAVPPQPQVRDEVPDKVKRPMTEADRKRQEMLEDLRRTGYKKERRDRVF